MYDLCVHVYIKVVEPHCKWAFRGLKLPGIDASGLNTFKEKRLVCVY